MSFLICKQIEIYLWISKLTLMTINNIELLEKSLNLGEISSIKYFMEISYFYQVYDDYLIIEKNYYKAVAELLKLKYFRLYYLSFVSSRIASSKYSFFKRR